MSLMRYVENLNAGDNCCVAWCEDGKSFVINHPDDFTRKIVPLFFKTSKPTKWSSFTRKLYRWGFRQINRGIGADDPIIFGNEFFQRDKEELIAKMRSVTSAGKQEPSPDVANMKRTLNYDEGAQKRMMLGHFLHQQKTMNMGMMPANVYGGMIPNGSMPLNHALRPGLAMNSAMGMMSGPPAMMMVPPVQSKKGQSRKKNPVMNPGMGPMAPSIDQMVPINPAMHPMPRFYQVPFVNSRPFSQAMQSGQTRQPPNPQSTADIVNAAIAALRHAK